LRDFLVSKSNAYIKKKLFKCLDSLAGAGLKFIIINLIDQTSELLSEVIINANVLEKKTANFGRWGHPSYGLPQGKFREKLLARTCQAYI
jgi:hypothetical protein